MKQKQTLQELAEKDPEEFAIFYALNELIVKWFETKDRKFIGEKKG